jgi:peptidoglycan hydrolase CwlO-like protein
LLVYLKASQKSKVGEITVIVTYKQIVEDQEADILTLKAYIQQLESELGQAEARNKELEEEIKRRDDEWHEANKFMP